MSITAIQIFISYRRADSPVFSQWLANELMAAYGPGCVFIDIDSIRDADIWRDRIRASLSAASILIVVIGKNWLAVRDNCERRRIDLEDDWVRREIEVGLEERKTVIPLLIEGAQLPVAEALPPSVRGLLELQARRVNADNIAGDIAQLVKDVGQRLGMRPVNVTVNYPFPLLKIKPLDAENLARLAVKLPDWRIVTRTSAGGQEKVELMRTYEFESFEDVIHFMNTAVRFIDRVDHHPDWTNVWRTLIVYLTTWDIGHKPSMLDVDLATYLDHLYSTNYCRQLSQRDLDNN